LVDVRLNGKVTGDPDEMVAVDVDAVSVKTGCAAGVPVPIKFEVTVGVEELSEATVSTPLAEPEVVGEKTRAIVQLPPAARVVVQVVPPSVLRAKGPVMETATLLTTMLPVFVSVNLRSEELDPIVMEPKFCEAGDRLRESVVPDPIPAPVREDVMDGFVEELEVTVRTPVAAPTAVGVKVRTMVQLVPASMAAGQLSPPIALVVDS
jgi:hypothetical protein